MADEQTAQIEAPTFQKKIGNTTYTVRVHFNPESEETFENKKIGRAHV